MKWAIQCADATTGQEFSLIVDADSQADAEAQARKKGLLVSEIIAAGEPAATDKQSPDNESQIRKVDPVDYAIAGNTVPDYRGLRWGATAFRILAYLCYVLGILALLMVIVESYATSAGGFGSLISISYLVQTAVALWPLVVGILFHVLAEACTALRDIARNSFRAET